MPVTTQKEDFLAAVVDWTYRRLLQQGLRQPFLEVELELWRQVQALYASHFAQEAS